MNKQTSNTEPKNLLERPQRLVQDRKTGEWYDPQDAFDKMMDKPEIQAVFERLKIR